MYRANSTAITNSNNIEIGRAPARSRYVLSEDRTDDSQWSANTIINSMLSNNIVLNASASARKLKSHNYRRIVDLLGGSFFEDVNIFGTNYSQSQPDLNNTNRQVFDGDIYGYNFNLNALTVDAFTQFKFSYKKIDFYLAQSYTRTEYQREGLYRNGFYPTNSFGYGSKVKFDNFGFKGGLTYKITGQHFFNVNGLYMTKAPTMRNTFNNSRFNNNIVANLSSETIGSADASYIIRTAKLKARITGYISKVSNATETSFFFADGVAIDDGNPDTDDSNSNFIVETVTNIGRRNIGAEFGLEYQATSTIKASLNAAYGEFTFDNNPNISINVDALASATNTAPTLDYGEAKIKGLRQSGTPQAAASFGLEYRDPKFWFINANINYFANNFIDVAPITRTDFFFRNPTDISGFAYPEATEARGRELLKQEKFANFEMLNLSGGKSWKVGRQTFGIFIIINNALDKTYKTGGFENGRNATFRDLNQDVSSGTPTFGPRYFYGFGRNYFVNLYINF